MIGPASGDQLKNYFTFAYYLKFDSGIWFTGMNYPFGELNIFTDNQPIISFTLNLIDDHLFNISDYAVGIMNYLFLISIIITAQILYSIHRFFKIAPLLATFSSVLIVFVSPQLYRSVPHITLSYMFVIPMVWLLMLKITTKRRVLLNTLLINLSICSLAFLHIYFFVMAVLIVMSFLLWDSLLDKKNLPNNLKIAASVLVVAFGVFLLINGIDPVADRPEQPWGISNYRSSFGIIFLPQIPPLLHILDPILNYRNSPFEGISYVGLLGLPAIACFAYLLIADLVGRSQFLIENKFLLTSALTALCFYLLGTGAIHEWIPELVYDLVKPLRQMRSLGRFSWVFYYILTSFYAVLLWKLYQNLEAKNRSVLGKAIVTISLAVWSYDTWNNLVYVDAASGHQNLVFNTDDEPVKRTLAGENAGDKFQAIMVLPYVHVGSEKVNKEYHPVMEAGFKWAYKTGLPMINVQMSRTSLSQSMENIQLVSSGLIEKKILNRFSDKPLLLITRGEITEPNQRNLVEQASLITSSEDVTFYSLPIAAFDDKKGVVYEDFINKKDSLTEFKPSYFAASIPQDFIHYSFNDLQTDHHFIGKGSKSLTGVADTIDLKIENGGDYELSFWMRLDPKVLTVPKVELYLDSENYLDLRGVEATDIYEDWIRISAPLSPTEKTKYQLIFKDQPGIIDEVMVRPLDLDIYSTKEGSLIMNNYIIH